MWRHKSSSTGKCKQGNRASSTQARSDSLFVVMVFFNFYLHVLIYFHFSILFDIFYSCFCFNDTSTSRQRKEAILGVFNDQEQQSTGATQVEATDQMVRATQQEVGEHQEEAPDEEGSSSNAGEEDGGGQQPRINYMLVQFLFYLDDFLYNVTNSNFTGCDALS
jgi:hypothetical protein